MGNFVPAFTSSVSLGIAPSLKEHALRMAALVSVGTGLGQIIGTSSGDGAASVIGEVASEATTDPESCPPPALDPPLPVDPEVPAGPESFSG